MKEVFFNSRGLRAGWRLSIFVAIYFALAFLMRWVMLKIPGMGHISQLPFLHPAGLIYDEIEGVCLALIPTLLMAHIEARRFYDYGIPGLRRAFGRDFWVGSVWGLGFTSLLIGLIALLGGYRVLGLAIHGGGVWYFFVLWIIANVLIGFSEELQFRAYILRTLSDGIGFWIASVLLSTGFGALHYFLKPDERW